MPILWFCSDQLEACPLCLSWGSVSDLRRLLSGQCLVLNLSMLLCFCHLDKNKQVQCEQDSSLCFWVKRVRRTSFKNKLGHSR